MRIIIDNILKQLKCLKEKIRNLGEHNLLKGLQGGNPETSEYYHLSKEQYDNLENLQSPATDDRETIFVFNTSRYWVNPVTGPFENNKSYFIIFTENLGGYKKGDIFFKKVSDSQAIKQANFKELAS